LQDGSPARLYGFLGLTTVTCVTPIGDGDHTFCTLSKLKVNSSGAVESFSVPEARLSGKDELKGY
jgi:hypothetical protein